MNSRVKKKHKNAVQNVRLLENEISKHINEDSSYGLPTTH